MIILNKNELKTIGFLRIVDLDDGECFMFLDDGASVYMKLYLTEREIAGYVDIEVGELYLMTDRDNNRPIRRVKISARAVVQS